MFSLLGRPKAFALDFSDLAIQLLEVRGPNGRARVTSALRVDIAPGVIENGAILDQQQVADVLHKAFADAKPKPPQTTDVVAELPESQTFLHHYAVPSAFEPDELEAEVLKQVESTMPIDISDYAWDFQVLSKTEEAYEILFAAAPAAIVETYEQTLALAGLRLVVLEPESLALTRSLVRPDMLEAGKGIVLLDIGGRGTTFVFVDSQGVRLSVTRPEGGRLITEALASKLKIKDAEAEVQKREKGMGDKTVADAVRQALGSVIEEYPKACEYYGRTTGQSCARILLTGGTSRLPGLAEHLSQAWGVPVAPGEPPLAMEGLEPEQVAVVAGLALRASRLTPGINFIVPA